MDEITIRPASVDGCNPTVPAAVTTYKIIAYLPGRHAHQIADELPDNAQAISIARRVSEIPGVSETSVLATVPGMVVNRLVIAYRNGAAQ